MRVASWVIVCAVVVGAPAWGMPRPSTAPAGQDAAPTAGDPAAEVYAELLALAPDGSATRVENVRLSRGPATFELHEGTWVPFAAVAGKVTGGVFLGSGTLVYSPPSGTEEDQLEKFTDERSLQEDFDRLYLRFTDATAAALAPHEAQVTDATPTDTRVVVQAADRSLLERAADLHEEITRRFLEQERVDLESRVLADLIDGEQGFFSAWVDTKDGGPLQFAQDPRGDDLFRLRGWHNRARHFDVWGGFGDAREEAARPAHYTIDMTLDGDDLEQARVELELVTRRPTRVLRLEASPYLDVDEVLDAAGEPLFFARREAEDDEFEDHLTVVLPEPLQPGTPTTLTFRYTGDIIDTPWGGGEYAIKAPTGWYPRIGYLQRATYEMTFRIDKDEKIFASGERLSDEVIDDVRVARFEQKLPVAIMCFNYGSMESREVDIEGAPPVMVFGTATGLGGDALGNVGTDVGNALVYFSQLFGEYPFSYMSATRIPYPHGQGFPGLLHLAAASFGNERRGRTEAFRAHETAHQWWGHMVGWESYRDQWISEGFAEYSGALYAAAYLGDPEILDDMTEAWRNDAFKKGNAGFGGYGMEAGLIQRHSDGSWSGPLTLGQRLSSSDTPADYAMLAYEKGAYILHMLRMAMYDWANDSDEAWRVMMRDFVASHLGGEASTESFRGIVEKHFGEDMGWFFDQYVYGTALPTYRYAWRVQTAIDGQRSLRLRVRQSVEPEVPFRMFVPLRVELGDDRFVVLRVLVDESYEEFTFDLPGGLEPENVQLNPRNAVLAEVDEERW
ncbi:MAG: M1 family aminopeptidase [Acidobacteriota bacterium]